MTDLEWLPVTVRLGDLSHWSDNPVTLSKAQAKKLLKSTERLGRMQTLAIGPQNGDGKHPLYDGHQRVNVWGAAFGMELQVNALQSSRPLTDEERHQVPIMLRTATGSLDWDALAGWDANNLMEWGFDSDMLDGWKRDIAALGNLIESEAPEPQDAEPQIDRAEELQEKWQVKTGDLWRIGEHRLLCGDSTKCEDVERVIGGTIPLLCVTDPPYGVNYDPAWRSIAAEEGHLAYAASRVGKVTNDNRSDWRETWALFPGDIIYSWHPAGATSLVHAAAIQDSGFVIRMQIIWAKSNFPIGRGDYHVRHEPCWYAVRKGKPARRTGDRTQTTLWEINLDRNVDGGHSTQKPLECMARPIRNHDVDEVYDPFVGSGTTIVACQNLDRKCRAIEISPAYCAVTLERMSTAFPALTIERIT